MWKALRSPVSKAASSRPLDAVAADHSSQAFLDYALIAGCIAAVVATVLTLITHGTLRSIVFRMTGAMPG